MESLISVVFSALTLEAVINDYAIEKLSREYFDQYIDRLGPVPKWAIVPELTKKRKISKSVLKDIKELFSLRNKIVHYKSKKIKNFTFEDVKQYSEKITDLQKKEVVVAQHANEATKTVMCVLRELKKIDKSFKTGWTKVDFNYENFISEIEDAEHCFEGLWKKCLKN